MKQVLMEISNNEDFIEDEDSDEEEFLSYKGIPAQVVFDDEKQLLYASDNRYTYSLSDNTDNDVFYYTPYKKTFETSAITLDPEYLCVSDTDWSIGGLIQDNYIQWVNEFYAIHPKYGVLFGDFEVGVYYEHPNALNDFLEKFPLDEWDYRDI